MRKRIYFDVFDGPEWPDPDQLKHYFFAPAGQAWSYRGGNDNWGLHVEGLYKTEHLTPQTGRVDVHLSMCGHPDHGVQFAYSKWDGRTKQKLEYSSKGDMRRLREYVKSLHGDAMPIGLFVPFPLAWPALKEFIETDGELPVSIQWIAGKDIPADVFFDPSLPGRR